MKKWILTVVLFVFVSVPIIVSPNKDELIRDMAAEQRGYYSVYLFWEGGGDSSQLPPPGMWSDLLSQFMSNERQVANCTVVDLDNHSSKYNYKRLLGISEAPLYVLLDDRRILMQTADPEQILNYLRERKRRK